MKFIGSALVLVFLLASQGATQRTNPPSFWVLDPLEHLTPRRRHQTGPNACRIDQILSAVEAHQLVILGAGCYWRAAGVVTAAAHRGHTRAMITAMLIFLCGVTVLALDVTGLLE